MHTENTKADTTPQPLSLTWLIETADILNWHFNYTSGESRKLEKYAEDNHILTHGYVCPHTHPMWVPAPRHHWLRFTQEHKIKLSHIRSPGLRHTVRPPACHNSYEELAGVSPPYNATQDHWLENLSPGVVNALMTRHLGRGWWWSMGKIWQQRSLNPLRFIGGAKTIPENYQL